MKKYLMKCPVFSNGLRKIKKKYQIKQIKRNPFKLLKTLWHFYRQNALMYFYKIKDEINALNDLAN